MFLLSKENIVEYVKSRLPYFDASGEVKVSAIGEGSVEEDGDGFINFVFRVSNKDFKLIVKQSRPDSRMGGHNDIDLDRFKLEYDSMKIRKAIIPEMIPDLYDCDMENRIFITQDVSHLRISRFQLLKGVQFPKLADHIAKYMAATEFYTSEYYLDGPSFRNLSVRFLNSTMRSIMDVGMFLTKVHPEDTVGREMDPEFITFAKRVCEDPALQLSRMRLRHKFMNQGECLIHGDLHTSNIFAGENETQVIDMEYTFSGPFSYDLGYFTANFIAQYEAATFRPFESEEARASFKSYCLSVVRDTYNKFCDYFCQYFIEDAKTEYQNIPGILEDFRLNTLREFIGFAASAQLGRIVGIIAYADYDAIEDYVQRHNAKCLSIIIAHRFLTHWDQYNTIDEIIEDIESITDIYCKNIATLEL